MSKQHMFYSIVATDCFGNQRFYSDCWKTVKDAVKHAKEYKRGHMFHHVVIKKQVPAPDGYIGLYWTDFRVIHR